VLPSVDRAFRRYHGPENDTQGSFHIRFPVVASALKGLRSLVPGEATRLRVTVVNESHKALGRGSDDGRSLALRFAFHDSSLGDARAAFYDEEGNRRSLTSGHVHEIERLGPGESTTFEGALALSPETPAYRQAALWASLLLARTDRPEQSRPVQLRAFDVRASRRFESVGRGDLLLVVNHRTTGEEVAAWRGVAESLGLSVVLWDVSLTGHLDLCAPVGGDAGLLEQLRGGTVVVLGHATSTAAGTASPHELLDKEQMHQALDAGIHFLFVGHGPDLASACVRTSPAEEHGHESPGALLDSLEAHGDPADVCGAAPAHRIGFFWERPFELDLAARATRLVEALARAFPERRYLVTYEPSVQTVWSVGLLKRWRMGSLTVRSTLGAARGALVHQRVQEATLHDPQWVSGPEGLMALLLAKSFEDKLTRFRDLLGSEAGGLTAIGDAMLVDLANEQRAVLASAWRGGLSRSEVLRALAHLRLLALQASSLPPLEPDSAGGSAVLRLLARLSAFSSAHVRWWEWPLLPLRRAPTVRRLVARLLEAALEGAFGARGEGADPDAEGRLAAARAGFEAQLAQLEVEREDAARTLALSGSEWAVMLLLAPLGSERVTSDAEVLSPADRVLSAEQMSTLAAQDAAARERRVAIARATEASRRELLRPEGWVGLSSR
jgi:hypothetical protein